MRLIYLIVTKILESLLNRLGLQPPFEDRSYLVSAAFMLTFATGGDLVAFVANLLLALALSRR